MEGLFVKEDGSFNMGKVTGIWPLQIQHIPVD